MNFSKAQKEIFNEILSGSSKAKCFNVDEKNLFVTANGFIGYIFPVQTIAFNIEKIGEMKGIPILDLIKDENELRLTPDVRIVRERPKWEARRLKGKAKNVFVDVKYIEMFQNAKFFQAESPTSIIVVAEKHRNTCIPVGAICPMTTGIDTTYYGDMKGCEADDEKEPAAAEGNRV